MEYRNHSVLGTLIVLSLLGGCCFSVYKIDKCSTESEKRELENHVKSGTITWEFETPNGSKVYSTQYSDWGTPNFGSIGPNGCNPKLPQRWYYGDCLDWEGSRNDATGTQVHPSCILIGRKIK